MGRKNGKQSRNVSVEICSAVNSNIHSLCSAFCSNCFQLRRINGGTVKFNSGIFYKDNCKNTLVTFGEDNKLKEKEEKDE